MSSLSSNPKMRDSRHPVVDSGRDLLAGSDRFSTSTKVQEDRSLRLRVFFRNVIVLLSIILVAELIYHFYIAPRLIITTVNITSTGRQPVDTADLLAKVGVAEGMGYLSMRGEEIARRLEENYLIESAVVTKSFPDTLNVAISPRIPLLVSLIDGDRGVVPVVMDQRGVVFQVGWNSYRALGVEAQEFPIVSGIRFPGVVLGASIPEELIPVFEQLALLRRDAPQLFGLLSEIRFVNRGGRSYDLILYFRGYRTRVRVDNDLSETLIMYVLAVMEGSRQSGVVPPIEELDFRGERVIYRSGGNLDDRR